MHIFYNYTLIGATNESLPKAYGMAYYSYISVLRGDRSLGIKHKMSSKQTVTINGKLFDVQTGQPVVSSQPPSHPAASQVSAQSIHKIQKFAPHTANHLQPSKKVISDIGPQRHPIMHKAHAAQTTKQVSRVHKPASLIKQQAVAKALEQAVAPPKKQHKTKRSFTPFQKKLQFAVVSIAVLLVSGYSAYITMPSLSTQFAASQAGIHASFPSYSPVGYKLAGPVTFDNGVVSMQFTANASPQSYTIMQRRSVWDSTAVKENFIKPKAGEGYDTKRVNGLTIYTYQNNAAWVNGGILYTILGDAPLSSDQVQRIAVSL